MLKKEVTIYDLALKLRLATSTISRALNDDPIVSKKTKKIIQETARELGYQRNAFARNLRNQKTNTIGVIIPELSSHFITSVLAGIERQTTASGYDLLIAHSSESHEKEAANAANLFHKRVDGLLASLTYTTRDIEHFNHYFTKHIPVVFFDRAGENDDYTSVLIDNYQCGYLATQHLIEQGCKRIVLATATLQRMAYTQRLQGYMNALNEHHIPYNPDYVLLKSMNRQGGIEIANEMLNMRERPDGLFCTNDFCAASAMLALKANNVRIPQDIAVVGFNDDPICQIIEPRLTTIRYSGHTMGEIAAQHLINRINGIPSSAHTNKIIIPSDLIVRNSSGKV